MKVFIKLSLIPIGIFVILILMLIKLFGLRITFFEINNKYFGHFALDIAIKNYQAKIRSPVISLACFTNKKSVNLALEEIARSESKFINRFFLMPVMAILNRLNNKFPKWLGYISYGESREFGCYPILALEECRITLTDSQQHRANEILDKYGLVDKQYICLAIRDDEYHGNNINNSLQSYRNLDFGIFEDVIRENQDYIFLKYGKSNNKTLGPKNFFDYSYQKREKSDLDDLVILNSCSALISSGEGVSAVANTFKKPVLYLNHSPYEVLCTFSEMNWIVPAIYVDASGVEVALEEAMNSDEIMLDLNLINRRNYKLKDIKRGSAKIL